MIMMMGVKRKDVCLEIFQKVEEYGYARNHCESAGESLGFLRSTRSAHAGQVRIGSLRKYLDIMRPKTE